MASIKDTIHQGYDGDIDFDVGMSMASDEEAIINFFSQMMTNEANAAIAAQQNELNYKMFNEQNQWNLDRRNEEWAYNDPSAQIQRLIDAGINPVFAAGHISPGSASTLSSANYPGAAGYSAASGSVVSGGSSSPLLDAMSSVDSFGNSVASAMSQFGQLGINARRQAVNEAMMPSEIAKNYADAAQSEQQAGVLDSVRQFNWRSFDDRLSLIGKEIEEISSKISNTDQDTKTKAAMEANLHAQEKKAIAETGVIKDYVQQGYERLALGWYQAKNDYYLNSQELGLNTKSVELAANKFELDKKEFAWKVRDAETSHLLSLLRDFAPEQRGKAAIDASMKLPGGAGVGASGELEGKQRTADYAKASAILDQIQKRFVENPCSDNLKAFQEAVELSTPVFNIPQKLPQRQPSYTPVWNPSY